MTGLDMGRLVYRRPVAYFHHKAGPVTGPAKKRIPEAGQYKPNLRTGQAPGPPRQPAPSSVLCVLSLGVIREFFHPEEEVFPYEAGDKVEWWWVSCLSAVQSGLWHRKPCSFSLHIFPLGVPLPQRVAGNIYSYGTHSKVWSNNFAVFSGLIYTVYRALRREAKFNLCFLLNYRGISLLKNFGNRVSEQVNLLFCYPLKSVKIGVT